MPSLDPQIQSLLTLAAVIISGIALLDKLFGKAAIEKEIAEIQKELAAVKTKVEPFWNFLEDHLPDMLKKPIHLRMDELLDKYKLCKESMSVEELTELENELLKARDEAKGSGDPRMMGYLWMAGVVNSRILEKKTENAGAKGQKARNGNLRIA